MTYDTTRSPTSDRGRADRTIELRPRDIAAVVVATGAIAATAALALFGQVGTSTAAAPDDPPAAAVGGPTWNRWEHVCSVMAMTPEESALVYSPTPIGWETP